MDLKATDKYSTNPVRTATYYLKDKKKQRGTGEARVTCPQGL